MQYDDKCQTPNSCRTFVSNLLIKDLWLIRYDWGGEKVNIIGSPSFIDKFRRAFKFIVSLHYTPRPLISSPIQTACRLLSIIKSSLLLWYVKCHCEQKYKNNLKKHIRKMLIVLKLIMKHYILFFSLLLS